MHRSWKRQDRKKANRFWKTQNRRGRSGRGILLEEADPEESPLLLQQLQQEEGHNSWRREMRKNSITFGREERGKRLTFLKETEKEECPPLMEEAEQ